MRFGWKYWTKDFGLWSRERSIGKKPERTGKLNFSSILPKKWKVSYYKDPSKSLPPVDFVSGEIQVTDKASDSKIAHLMAILKWSPASIRMTLANNGVEDSGDAVSICQSIDAIRVDKLATAKGIDLTKSLEPFNSRDHSPLLYYMNNLAIRCKVWDLKRPRKILPSIDTKLANELVGMLSENPLSIIEVYKRIQQNDLQKYLKQIGSGSLQSPLELERYEGTKTNDNKAKPASYKEAENKKARTVEYIADKDRWIKGFRLRVGTRTLKEDHVSYFLMDELGKYGEMQIQRPTLDEYYHPRRTAYRYTTTDLGRAPHRVHRLLTDGKALRAKRRLKRGGTLLVDVSGSMSFTLDDLRIIMELLPAATIAIYNGNRITGNLSILAARNRRVTDEAMSTHMSNYHDCGGNTIDGKALVWLSRQQAPKMWLSDGYVTGLREVHGEEMMKSAARYAKHMGIKRYDTIKELTDWLEVHSS